MIDSIVPLPDLLLVGASTRAAAFSALRAGYRPVCLDFYSDADLRVHAAVETLPDDPQALRSRLQKWPGVPVVYTGGMENRPDLLNAIAATHPLWGNSAEVVSRARNYSELKEVARLSRVGLPEWKDSLSPPPSDGTWLLRPVAGTGGRGIQLWTDAARQSPTLQEPHCYQKRVEGESYSALFIASGQPGDVRFIGLTRQLIGLAECHSSGFQWCGNLGPVALPVAMELLIRRFGNVSKWKLGLVGLFGVDFIVAPDDTLWITEVNPRYPASLELLEHVTGIPFLLEHIRCFAGDAVPEPSWNQAHPGEFLAKGILYSPDDLLLQSPLAEAALVPFQEVPELTDLPPVGTLLRRGEPVCTVFAEATSVEKTMSLLHDKLRETTTRLQERTVPVSADPPFPEKGSARAE